MRRSAVLSILLFLLVACGSAVPEPTGQPLDELDAAPRPATSSSFENEAEMCLEPEPEEVEPEPCDEE